VKVELSGDGRDGALVVIIRYVDVLRALAIPS
jgi:hypothetical protein